MHRKTTLELMKNTLNHGGVYRRSNFKKFTSNTDRNLAKLIKLQNSLHFCPQKTPFGQALPDERKLLKKVLK